MISHAGMQPGNQGKQEPPLNGLGPEDDFVVWCLYEDITIVIVYYWH